MSLIKILGLKLSLIFLSTVLQNPNEIRILLPDTYHDGEVSYSEKSEIWLGLYNEKDSFYLKEIKVDFERVNDPILDMEDEKTAEVDQCVSQRNGWIINDINHYNTWINYRLFLSSYAETDEIVKEVANLTGQGC